MTFKPGFTVILGLLLFASLCFGKITIVTNDTANKAQAVTNFPFYIYSENVCENYFPSGYMGDTGDLSLDLASAENPFKGKTCIHVGYTSKKSQNQGWAGIYWQNPVNNWGDKLGGFDLGKAKSLVFYVRGKKGGEKVQFTVGGISGKLCSDTASFTTGVITLTKDWKKTVLSLEGSPSLSRIMGGFCFTFSSANDPEGCEFYLDEIYFSDRQESNEKK